MKKIYLPIVTLIGCLILHAGVYAQTVTFTGNNSSFWNNAGNWDSGDVPNGNHAGATIFIPLGKSVVLTGSISLTNVVIKVAGSLQIGNGSGGGANAGSLTLSSTSVVSLEYDGTTRGVLTSNTIGNTNNIVTIGGTTKFQGGTTDYSATNTGSGVSIVTGPARATSSTGTGSQSFIAGALPVVLVGFSANLASNDKVSVKWTTQQEISTDHFEIQRSSDGIGWQTIATVKASGYSSMQQNYAIEDAAPQTGTNLYRLRMFDLDSHFGFSSVVNVHLNALGKISLFPNPSVNFVTVSLGRVPASDWTLTLLNINGQVIVNKRYGKDQTTVSMPVLNVPNGNYTVEISDGISKQNSKLLIAHH